MYLYFIVAILGREEQAPVQNYARCDRVMVMKIIHIISSLQRGGAEMALANLLHTLQNQAEHQVIFFHDGPVRKTIEELGIPCIQIRATGSYANPLFFLRLLKKIKQFAPACIHTDLWAANVLGRICAWLLKIPCVSVVHAMTEHEGKLRATIDRIIPCRPTYYVAVSPAVKESLQKNRRLHQAPCVVIKNGIDAQALQTTGMNKSCTLFSSPNVHNKFIIGAVGRLIQEKNYDVLLDSFATVCTISADIHLVVVGSGPEEQKLKLLAEQLQIADHVTWVGNQLAHPYYSFFNCFVQPSRSEGLSIALLEALACNLPVIVTGNNKQHPVIQDQMNGLVIEPDDSVALTHALQTYLENPTLRKSYGASGYQTVTTQFSMQQTAQAYQTLFEEITK